MVPLFRGEWMKEMDSHRQKTRVALLSVVSNAALVAAKLVAGFLSGSVSIVSEAIHSGVDLLAAVIAFVSVRKAGEPADDDHPFGHGKYENISGAVEALLIFGAAGWIIKEAIDKLHSPEPIGTLGWGVAVMLASALVNTVVSRVLMAVGRRTDSIALRADAWHLRTDVYTSIGVMAGLTVIWIGGRLWPSVNLLWVDPVVAIAVALLIVKAAWDLTSESVRDLLDSRIAPVEEAWIRSYVSGLYPRVQGFHRLRTRKAGATRFVDFHLIVDGAMTVADSHQLSDSIVEAIIGHLPQTHVNVHVEPCDGKCKPVCVKGCLRSQVKATAPSSRP
jgi:cation diffusion facilitator family transporter